MDELEWITAFEKHDRLLLTARDDSTPDNAKGVKWNRLAPVLGLVGSAYEAVRWTPLHKPGPRFTHQGPERPSGVRGSFMRRRNC